MTCSSCWRLSLLMCRLGAQICRAQRPSPTPSRERAARPHRDVARGRSDRRRLRRARRRRGRGGVPLLGIVVRALRGDGSAAFDVRRAASRGSVPARRGRVRGRAARPLRRQRRAVLHVPPEGHACGHPGGRGRGGARGKAQRKARREPWRRARRARRARRVRRRRSAAEAQGADHVCAGPTVHEREQGRAPMRVLAESRRGPRGNGRRLRDL